VRKGAGLLLFASVLVADQVSKVLALAGLGDGAAIAVTPFFNLVLVWNRGVSFGMLAGADRPWVLVALAAVIATLLVYWLRREERLWSRRALWLVLAGAVGNVIDRLRFGAVVDFLDFHVGGYHWPAFNVADSAICIGAGLLVLDGLILSRPGAGERTGRA
jgi:signal peptidase II